MAPETVVFLCIFCFAMGMLASHFMFGGPR